MTAPQSPCTKICQLNEQQICIGCGRSLEEIGQWSKADNQQRQIIVEQAAKRLINITTER